MTNSKVISNRKNPNTDQHKLNVLMVEDNLLNSKLLSIFFSEQNINLSIADNGMEAIDKLNNQPFDIVLMDMEMPVMNGFEAIKIIRHKLKNCIPVIAMSANTMPAEINKFLQSGMNDFIAKPVDTDILFEKINKLTGNNLPAENIPGVTVMKENNAITEKVCKLDYLVNVTRGNKQMMSNIIKVFLEETPVELNKLNEAIGKTDYPVISDMSHKIKSSFSIFGISMLEPVFDEMEQLGTGANNIEKIIKLNQDIHKVFGQVKIEME